MEPTEARRLRELEEENARLKKLLSEPMLHTEALRDVHSKNGEARDAKAGRPLRPVDVSEGAGKFSKPDKSRFYSIAIGSATESAAMFDVCLRRQLIAGETHERGKQLLERIVAMLIKLCRALRDD